MHILFLILCGLIVGSVAIRLVTWALKHIYEWAPFVIIAAVLLLILWGEGAFLSPQERMEKEYAGNTRTAQVESGRSK